MSVAGHGSHDPRHLSPRHQQVVAHDGTAIRIGLINNMSDGAIARTECHFTN